MSTGYERWLLRKKRDEENAKRVKQAINQNEESKAIQIMKEITDDCPNIIYCLAIRKEMYHLLSHLIVRGHVTRIDSFDESLLQNLVVRVKLTYQILEAVFQSGTGCSSDTVDEICSFADIMTKEETEIVRKFVSREALIPL